MIRTILVEDEPLALKNLSMMVSKYGTEIEVVATANNLEDAIEQICLHKPNLVFMDIELGGRNSFEILEQFPMHTFEVIFVTAYKDFGIQAIKEGALDYILKPINKLELFHAIQKADTRIQKAHETKSISNTNNNDTKNQKIALPTNDGLIFIDPSSIIYCESEGRYTRFYLDTNKEPKKIIVAKNMGEYETVLPSDKFIRIHHHYIINLSFIDRYIKGSGGTVVMNNGTELPVSKRKKEDFFKKLEGS